MFLFRTLFSRTPVLGGLVAAAVLLAAGPAPAQQPNIPPGTKPFQAMVIAQDYARQVYAQKLAALSGPRAAIPQRPTVGPLIVTVTTPTPAEALEVTLRGPDGVARSYLLESGRASIQTRQVIVRQGETASFRIMAAAPK